LRNKIEQIGAEPKYCSCCGLLEASFRGECRPNIEERLMAKSVRARGGDKGPANTTDLLVERQPADGSNKSDSNAAAVKSSAVAEDRSFAVIHTGSRVEHQPIEMPPFEASTSTPAVETPPARLRTLNAVAADVEPAPSHAGEMAASTARAAAAGGVALTEARLPSGTGLLTPHSVARGEELSHHVPMSGTSLGQPAPTHHVRPSHVGEGAGAGVHAMPTPAPISSVTIPRLLVSAAAGLEDQAIHLDILPAPDGAGAAGEFLVAIGNLPVGATLSVGAATPDGTWILAADQLDGLTLTLPPNMSGSLTLSVTPIVLGADEIARAGDTVPLIVDVEGVADEPTLSAESAVGLEDTAIPLTIAASLVDIDGFESLTITIAGVPEGAALSAGAQNNDGSWTLTVDQLAELTLAPPTGMSGSFDLTVTATSHEAGTTASTTLSLPVEIIGALNAPTLEVTAASGSEDTPIPLTISAGLVETSPTTSLSVTIDGLPAGATLSTGTQSADGIWTLTGEQLPGLTLTPAPNSGEDFTLTVTATTYDSLTGAEATTTATLPVDVVDVLDAPTLEVMAVRGLEGTALPLAISAGLTDISSTTSLSVTIDGLPEGATLSAGTQHPDGTWSLTGDQLVGLTLTPAPDSDEDFTLTVRAIAYDSLTDTEAITTATLPVEVVDVLDAPTLTVLAATGLEDTAIRLNISVGLTELSPTISLSVIIGGLPSGATLSAGTQNADGTWTLTGEQLVGLTLTPAPDSGEDFTLNVTATAHDSLTGTEATTTATLPVEVVDVLDAPTLGVTAASGLEDTAIPLSISAGLVDVSPTTSLSVTIDGLPAGAALSAGTQNADGTWTLIADQLVGLTLTPAPDSDEDFTLTVRATAYDSLTGTEATTTATLPVEVVDVLDVPTLAVAAASGLEDTAIPLSISAGLVDVSPTTSLSVTVDGLPAGATLSAGTQNADGTWTLASDQLAGLTLTPAPNFSEDFTLNITAIAYDSLAGIEATTTATLPVEVIDVLDAPTLEVAAASGAEDTAIPLTISAGLVDISPTTSLSVVIDGLPAGATLSAGIQNPDGTWTLTGDQLVGLTLAPAPDSGEDFTLTVRATAYDSLAGTEATTTATLLVEVIDVLDAPALTVAAASGFEDTVIPLSISAGLTSLSPTTSLSVIIDGLPVGASLSAGTQNADGTWTLTGGQLAGLTLTPAPNSGEDFTLSIAARAYDSLTGTEATTTATLPVEVVDVLDAPTLTVAAASGLEDTAIPLTINAGLVDVSPTTSLSITIDGLPTGATLSAGTQNVDGTWTLMGDQLVGLTLTPAPDSGEDFTLTVRAIAYDGLTGTEVTTTATLPVEVVDVLDAPTLTVAAVSGLEDTAIPLAISAGLVDVSPTTTLSVAIDGLPAGATLSAGAQNADGTWTLTGDQLVGLTLTPTPDSGEDFTLTVTATAYDSLTGTAAITTATLPVEIIDVLDAPSLTVVGASGLEGTAIPLAITAGLVDISPTTSLSVTVDGLPAGATLSAGTQNADGTWTLTGDQLAGLTVTPAPNSGEDFTLSITATAYDSLTGTEVATTATLPVEVIDVFDAPTLTVAVASGLEDTAIPLAISAGLVDISPTTSLSVTIAGLPAGATLSAGTQNADGTWTLAGDQLAGLTVTPAPNSAEDFALNITATAHDSLTGIEATTTATLPVEVIDVLDAPSLTVVSASGLEDTAIPLSINAELVDISPTTSFSIAIDGLPAGATLSAGTQNADGTWTLTGDQLAGLTVTPAPNSAEDFALNITATAHDNLTGIEATTTATLPVEVVDVLDAPSLTVVSASGLEDTAIPLSISAGLVDVSPTTSLSITIDGLPAGATLSAGTENADGTWTLTGDELVGLTLTPALGSGEDFTLNIAATAYDSLTGTEATITAMLPVEVIDVLETDTGFLSALEELTATTVDTTTTTATDPIVTDSMSVTTIDTASTEETTTVVTAEPVPPPPTDTGTTFTSPTPI
jgi:large repetitive protein